MLNKFYAKVRLGKADLDNNKVPGASVRDSLRRTCLAASLLPTVLLTDSAFAAELNSERIERYFGSYSVQVLEESAELRVSSLNSRELSGPVCRTLAVVRYAGQPRPPSLQMAHREILRGGSIGATLTAAGWRVEKTTRYLGELSLTADDLRLRELMQINAEDSLALHIYDLHGVRDRQRVAYATIVEIHHPDYLSASDLARIYENGERLPLSETERRALLTLTREKMRGARPEKAAILLNL